MRRLTVVMYTCAESQNDPRAGFARKTLDSCLRNLVVDADRTSLRVHIAADKSGMDHIDDLMAIVRRHTGHLPTLSMTSHGYGGSYNLANQTTHELSDYLLALEDDWELLRPLPIDPLMDAIGASGGVIDCIRLGGLGWTNELHGGLVHYADQTFLLFAPDSTEVHVFAGGPRLETVEFEREVGEWPEDIGAGYTEMEVSNRPSARRGVVWPLDAGINASQQRCNTFAHIGSVKAGQGQPVESQGGSSGVDHP